VQENKNANATLTYARNADNCLNIFEIPRINLQYNKCS